mgnify:CR=1 FL=1
MKKQVLLSSVLSVSLLMPLSQAKAQGWPTFDVAKLAALVTNLVGRYQPIPEVLNRVNQVKTMQGQIEAVGQAAAARDLKSMGKATSEVAKSDAFKGLKKEKTPIAQAAEGSNGADEASKKVKSSLFALKDVKLTAEQRSEIRALRKEYQKGVNAESVFFATNAAKQSQERLDKADAAAKNANTLQDNVNANTLMLMAGNMERLNQIALKLSTLQQKSMETLNTVPVGGYPKPEPVKDLQLGQGTYSVEEKDEINVNFE